MDLPLHPKIVHLPIALAVLLPLLSGGLLLAWWRGWLPPRVWTLVAAGQLLLVGSGVLALRSGEADEDRVERLVPEAALEAHEEAGERFVWAAALVAGLALLPLLLRGERARLAGATAACAGTFVVLALGYDVGARGGELVYRHGAAAAFAAPGAVGTATPSPRRRDDDD